MRLIVLAAERGIRFGSTTDDRPKALVPFMGRPILDWALDSAARAGITDVAVVGGHCADRLETYPVRHYTNAAFETTGSVTTLMTAEPAFGDAFVMSSGDIVYKQEVLNAVLASTAEVGVAVDLDWRPYWERRFGDALKDAKSLRMAPDGRIRSIGRPVQRVEDIHGQYVGLVVFRGNAIKILKRVWARARDDAAYRRPILGRANTMARLAIADVLDELATAGDVAVKAIPIHGGWVEINSPEDLAPAEERWNGNMDAAAAGEAGTSTGTATELPLPPTSRVVPVNRQW
jgi:L-glutamine-phosphate cytidylyltransferase